MKSIPSVGKFKSRKEWEDYIWSQLTKKLAEIGSVKEIEDSLNILLTMHEKKQMIKRASAISLLRQGKSYLEIGERLWLSPTTISAIRKSMRTKGEYVSRYTRNKKPEKKQKQLTKKEWEQIQFSLWIESLFTLPPPPIPHPKLNKMLGISYKSSQNRKNRYKR